MISALLCCNDDLQSEVKYSDFITIHASDHDDNGQPQDALAILEQAASESLNDYSSYGSTFFDDCKKSTVRYVASLSDVTTGIDPDESYAYTVYYMRFRKKLEKIVTKILI